MSVVGPDRQRLDLFGGRQTPGQQAKDRRHRPVDREVARPATGPAAPRPAAPKLSGSRSPRRTRHRSRRLRRPRPSTPAPRRLWSIARRRHAIHPASGASADHPKFFCRVSPRGRARPRCRRCRARVAARRGVSPRPACGRVPESATRCRRPRCDCCVCLCRHARAKLLSVEQRRLPPAHLRERQNQRQRLFVDSKRARDPPRRRPAHARRLRPRNLHRLPVPLVESDREAKVRRRNHRRRIRPGEPPRRAARLSQAGIMETAAVPKRAWRTNVRRFGAGEWIDKSRVMPRLKTRTCWSEYTAADPGSGR